MNHRPSMNILATAEMPVFERVAARSARSLRWRLLFVAGVCATLILGGVAYAGLYVLKRSMGGDEDARVENAASLSKQLVERVLAERRRQVEMIASAPPVIAAAHKGAEISRQRGLPAMPIPQLEQMFKATRSQQVDDGARSFLSDLLPKLDIAEMMVTDEFGFNAVTTSPSSDFVQSDEAWWQTAWNVGHTEAQATADAATQRTVVELSDVIRDRGAKVGVVKVKFGLSVVDSVLAQGSAGASAFRIDLVDSLGKVIASSVPSTRFKPFPGFDAIVAHDAGGSFEYKSDSTLRHASVSMTNGGRWRVVAHISEEDATRTYNIARWALIAGVGAMLLLIVASLIVVGRFIDRRITGPAHQLAIAAEAVAAGDLSKHVNEIGGDDEIGRLARAIAAMIAELRRLATALQESANETATMTSEITASSEEMAASAGQIAHTASDLSSQANTMAQTIQDLAGSSESLVGVATDLDAGARDGVERNAKLRALAVENRARLDDCSRSLDALKSDVEASAASIEQLAEASEEVRTFVTLVQKLARQSKLLALNAAMEAARAGDQGHGFAVVAEEVRRLAAMSSDAAERTERVVAGVLDGISHSRASTGRTVDTVKVVRGATEEGSRSFGQIERAVEETDVWTSSIAHAVTSTNGLAREMSAKLESLSAGTESFAAAMEEVAASSEEQSASTEEIAAAASTLSGAADRLNRIVAHLRLEKMPMPTDPKPAPPAPSTPRISRPVRLPPDAGIGYKPKRRPLAKA
jgi:methyl-accepting chemotaxis protein